jgi:hypothetical protein
MEDMPIATNRQVLLKKRPIGDYVACVGGSLGLQDYAVSTGQNIHKVDPSAAPLECYVGGLGLNGFTAYVGLLCVGRPLPSDTVVVSSAAGATGSIAAQISRWRRRILRQCRRIDSRCSADAPAPFGQGRCLWRDLSIRATGGKRPASFAIGDSARTHGRICGVRV